MYHDTNDSLSLTTQAVRRSRQIRGSYLVLTTVFVVVFLSLCGLVFGSAILATSRVRLQNLSNLVAYTALSGYMAETDATATVKVASSVAAAQAIIAKNSIPNSRTGYLGNLSIAPDTSGESGYIEYGTWYQIKPLCTDEGCDPCSGTYPCFKVLNPNDLKPEDKINATKAILKTQSDNPILAPTTMLGGDHFSMSESSIASLVPRCIAFVLDISTSTYETTHYNADDVGWLAYRVIDDDTLDDADSMNQFKICDTIEGFDHEDWCNTDSGSGPIAPNKSSRYFPPPMPNAHFSTDYSYIRTPISDGKGPRKFLIDGYSFVNGPQPEPLTTFLRAFNAGAQQVAEKSASGDALGVIAYDGKVESDTGVSNSVDLIRQLTNIRRAFSSSSKEIRHPNFADWNWFPFANPPGTASSGSDLNEALHDAYFQLNDPVTCPAFSKKMIFLATDGKVNGVDTARLPIQNCATNNHCAPDNRVVPGTINSPCYSCPGIHGVDPKKSRFVTYNDFVTYTHAEAQMLDQNISDVGQTSYGPSGIVLTAPSGKEAGIIKMLADANIAVTVLLSGQFVHPNFRNVIGPDGKYVNPEDAAQLGWDGLPINAGVGNFNPFVKWTSANQLDANMATANAADAATFSAADSNNPFLRANGLMAELAFRTGGIFCPLMATGDLGDYEDDDNDDTTPKVMTQAARAARPIQDVSFTYRTTTEQAFDCISKAIGANPYTLQEEWSPPVSNSP